MVVKLPTTPGGRCRNCFNKFYETKLVPTDCRYEYAPSTCSLCGEVKNIIGAFTFKGKLKLFFGHKKVYYAEIEDPNINNEKGDEEQWN